MSELIGQIAYYTKKGRANTGCTLALAQERAAVLGIKTVLVATSSGETGALAAERFSGFDGVWCVKHQLVRGVFPVYRELHVK